MGLNLILPGESLASITPNDSADLARPTRAVYVGTSGDLKVTDISGNTVTLYDLAAGMFHPIRVVRIFSTGTTASDIAVIY